MTLTQMTTALIADNPIRLVAGENREGKSSRTEVTVHRKMAAVQNRQRHERNRKCFSMDGGCHHQNVDWRPSKDDAPAEDPPVRDTAPNLSALKQKSGIPNCPVTGF